MQLKQGTKRLFWKTTTFVVLLCFTATSIAWSNPSYGSEVASLETHPFARLKKLSLPENLGRIDEVYLPEGVTSESPFIVYLQDAHANLGAQENIARIADEIGPKLKIEAILKEGGSGEADLTELRSFPDPKIKSGVTRFWMEEAVLSGIEREAIIGSRKYRFFGIEDPIAYEAGGKYFIQTQSQAEAFLASLKPLIERNRAQQKKIFNPELLRFEELASKFEGKDELIAFVSFIANEARNLHINRWKYLEIEKFIDLILLEMEGGSAERFFKIQKTMDSRKFFSELDLLKTEVKEKLFQNQKERVLDYESQILKNL
ncbi:MAG: hypothetical protein HY585_00815, partial [Candidatus Omnitrophica bacterium]|nr:hypothetical protein [Candidatus Omnitrophota bacterium]